MTETITAAREALADLAAGATGYVGHAFMPAKIQPGIVIVLPASPYLQPGESYGTFTLRLEVSIVVSAVNNATAATTLDELIVEALVAIANADGWNVHEVFEPSPIGDGQGRMLAGSITVTTVLTP